MGRLQLWTLALTLIALPVSQGPPAMAAAVPNILLVNADEGEGSVAFEGVVDELSAALQDRGFAVYDEAVVSNTLKSDAGRSTQKLIEAARSTVRPPIDLLLMLSVRSKTETLTYTTRIGSQVAVRLVNVTTGQHLGNLKVASPRALRVPLDCEEGCLAEVVERDTRRLARGLGKQLTARLTKAAGVAPDGVESPAFSGMPDAYSLVFEGFSAQEVFEIEEYLVVFSGYRNHRPVSTASQRHEYWYETAIARGRLNRNLSKMLDYLDMPGQVDLSGNIFTVTKAVATEGKTGWDDW